MGRKLYVGNLSYQVDSSELQQLFGQHGTVVSAQVISDRETGRSKGFGFVAVPDAEKDVFVHASVLQRNGLQSLMEGQTVVVEVVQGAKGPEAVAVRMA